MCRIRYLCPIFSLCFCWALSAISWEANCTNASPVDLPWPSCMRVIPFGTISNPVCARPSQAEQPSQKPRSSRKQKETTHQHFERSPGKFYSRRFTVKNLWSILEVGLNLKLTREEVGYFLLGASKRQASQPDDRVIVAHHLVRAATLHHPLHFAEFWTKN